MTDKIDGNIIGFYASFNADENVQELAKSYLWGDQGLKNKLAHLKWKNYGEGLRLILFQVYVKPIPCLRNNLRDIESYRPKEKSIGIPVILDNDNFFNLSESDRLQFFSKTIIEKLRLVELKVKRKKLEFDITLLITDVAAALKLHPF